MAVTLLATTTGVNSNLSTGFATVAQAFAGAHLVQPSLRITGLPAGADTFAFFLRHTTSAGVKIRDIPYSIAKPTASDTAFGAMLDPVLVANGEKLSVAASGSAFGSNGGDDASGITVVVDYLDLLAVDASASAVASVAGNVSGSVASVAGNVGGSVASVVGNLGGSVTGSVASVLGNVGGNLVGNVNGTVASVVGNLGGNVAGTVASVVGNVGGSVAGSVASVTGNLGGNVVGSVGSVAGAVGSVTGSVGGSVAGSVGSVTGNLGGNVNGNLVGNVNGQLTGVIADLALLDMGDPANLTGSHILRALWSRFFGKGRATRAVPAGFTVYNDDGTIMLVSPISDDGTAQICGPGV